MMPDSLDTVFRTTRAEDQSRVMTVGEQILSTYVFKTRQGGKGILQIIGVGYVDKPRGIKIQYKLVQKPQSRS